MTSPIVLLGLAFGPFPEIDHLNRRFVPGREKLKLTLDLDMGAVAAGVDALHLAEDLAESVPTLPDHACRGEAAEDVFPGSDPDRAADFAHLLEHVIIDLLHYTARMDTCSGITCGHRVPPTRFDLFVETPDRPLGRLCVTLGVGMLEEALRGNPASPFVRNVASLARYLHAHPRSPITGPAAASIIDCGDAAVVESIRVLADAGYIREADMSMNFSGTPSWVKRVAPEDESSLS